MGNELIKQFEAEPQTVADVEQVLEIVNAMQSSENPISVLPATVSKSSTESDLYEEITPVPTQLRDISVETQRKLDKCSQQLTQETTKSTTPPSEPGTVKAPIATLDETLEEVCYRIFSGDFLTVYHLISN